MAVMVRRRYRWLAGTGLLLLLAACASVTKVEPPQPTMPACAPCAKPTLEKPSPPTWVDSLKVSSWDALPGWAEDPLSLAWPAFLQSCAKLGQRPAWQPVCADAATLWPANDASVRGFFEARFTPYSVINADGGDRGMITGYYEPFLRGSRIPDERFRFPVYAVPEDLLTIDLAQIYPELKSMRLRGRLEGRRVLPYYSREQIEAGQPALAGHESLWVDDEMDLFFLQIQGSGRVVLADGEIVRVAYADQNGHPYRAIGRVLVERGELTAAQATMPGIRQWAHAHPEKLPELLNSNPSFVFFREAPASDQGPVGALGVPLSAGRSVAVDPRALPLGAPVYLATTWPESDSTLRRLMMAQDTGGAIKGAVRADLFWGAGEEAGALAGKMRQDGRLWVLLPHGFALDQQP